MRPRTFGATGMAVPAIGQGTWNMERDDRRSAVAALRRGVELGMKHVDTAEMYGAGRVEELVGEAIQGLRDEVFLVSKILPEHASRQGTRAACEASLRRLRTDRLDCYLLHWQGPHPMGETIDAFEELAAAGLIRAWGVSNFDERLLGEALAIAGAGRIACNQVLYHLEERAIEHAVIPLCEQHDIAVVGYSPFGSGRFPRADSPGGVVLAEIAARHGATPRQVALAFLTRRESLLAIPKSASAAHVAENGRAAELELSPEEQERLDDAFPRGPHRGGVPMI